MLFVTVGGAPRSIPPEPSNTADELVTASVYALHLRYRQASVDLSEKLVSRLAANGIDEEPGLLRFEKEIHISH